MNKLLSPCLPTRRWTAADLVARFGALPQGRVRAQPAPGTATEADVERQGDIGERCCELIDGVLLERTTGIPESVVAVTLARYLTAFVQKRRLGLITGAEGIMRMAPGLILIPDVSFISLSRCPEGKVTRKPIPNLVPDLAVEVLSKNNSREEMEQKLRYYFRAGGSGWRRRFAWIQIALAQVVC
jgi:Uma2 family endonuclease